MCPECVIASWDALGFLLDAENIERRVQLDAEKKSNVYANYKLQEKTASHDMTENPTAKYEKFWFRGSLLINCGCASIVVSVAPNLTVLPRTLLENNKTRDNKFISLEHF